MGTDKMELIDPRPQKKILFQLKIERNYNSHLCSKKTTFQGSQISLFQQIVRFWKVSTKKESQYV